MQTLTFVSASIVVIIRVRRTAEVAAIVEITDPPAKKKRSEEIIGELQGQRRVPVALNREIVALVKCDFLQERSTKLDGGLDKAQHRAKASLNREAVALAKCDYLQEREQQ